VANLRKESRGMHCMIRLEGVCNGNTETTVLCHYRLMGTSGMGIKPDDEQAAWGCSSCHSAVDGRTKTDFHSYADMRLAHAEAVLRTQYARRHGVKL
jgi:Protein of unknown function (DUF1364)